MKTIRFSQQRARRTLLSFAVVFAAAAPARNVCAQEPELSKHDRALAEETMRSRNRSTMHPGDPLLLIGQEQGDNEIRSRTPALENATHTGAQVDPEELYQRALAVYGDRAMFPAPPHAGGSAAAASGGGRATHTPDTEGAPATPAKSGTAATGWSRVIWAWGVGSFVTLALIAWFLRRWRVMFAE